MMPIVIKWRAFRADIYDVNGLLAQPMATTRKLWRLMFDAVPDNEETIGAFRTMLSEAVAAAKHNLTHEKFHFIESAGDVKNAKTTVAVFGSVATKEQKEVLRKAKWQMKLAENRTKRAAAQLERTEKLQNIFNEMAAKAKI